MRDLVRSSLPAAVRAASSHGQQDLLLNGSFMSQCRRTKLAYDTGVIQLQDLVSVVKAYIDMLVANSCSDEYRVMVLPVKQLYIHISFQRSNYYTMNEFKTIVYLDFGNLGDVTKSIVGHSFSRSGKQIVDRPQNAKNHKGRKPKRSKVAEIVERPEHGEAFEARLTPEMVGRTRLIYSDHPSDEHQHFLPSAAGIVEDSLHPAVRMESRFGVRPAVEEQHTGWTPWSFAGFRNFAQ
jgi:hypothetical protein